MLAALQQDSFPPGSIDPSSSLLNSDAYGSLAYMDTSIQQDDSSSQQPGVFSDYVSGSTNSFDVGSFNPQELSIPSQTPSGGETEREVVVVEAVKSEGSA
jgi:regulatory factor X